MADEKKGVEAAEQELAEFLSHAAPPAATRLREYSYRIVSQHSAIRSLLENAQRGLEERLAPFTPQATWLQSALGYPAHFSGYVCAVTPQEAAEGELNAVTQLEAARNILEEAAARVSEDLKLAEQVLAQIGEVDAIIERLRSDREEIDRLKEETRSNISELQRMVAA